MRFGRNGGSRFASTTSTDTPFADIQSELPTPSESPIPSDEPFLSTSLDNITSTVPPPVYEHLGFLKELGLDYGWGFTASVEWLLEHVHVYAGTPWWASLGLTMLLIRACLLKTYIGAADSSARGQFIAPLTEPLMARMKEAQAQRDMAGSQKALRELKDLRARAGVKTWKIFLPFIQVPIGFGTFRLVRGMSTLPVPGLDTGGLLWMKDLTLSDPYFILPMLTAASYYVAFKIGGESGGNSMMTPTVQNIFLYVLPPLGGLFMCYWPGALQFTLLVQAIISLVQSTAFKQPWFREMLGIHPLPGPGDLKPNTNTYSGTINKSITLDPAAEAKKKGIFGGAQADIRSAYSAMKDKAKDYQQKSGDVGKRSMIEIEHARKYDERRRREIAQLKFEQEQRRLEDEERKQRLLGKSRR